MKNNSQSKIFRKDDLSLLTYRGDIDGLRAIAVSFVIIYHAFPNLLPGGFIGVDIFFVISGYLIGGLLIAEYERTGNISYLNFVIRRFRRIMPALLIVILASIIVGYSLLVPEDFLALVRTSFSALFFYTNFQLWSEAGYTDAASASKPLLHLWSLAVEEQFYLFWPITIFAIWKWVKSRLLLLSFMALFSVALSIYLTPFGQTTAFYFPFTRFWELICGTIIYLISKDTRLNTVFISNLTSFIGISTIILSAFLINSADFYPGWKALFPVIGTSLLIAAGPNAFLNHNLLKSKPFVYIGLISYPMYLWHWPILVFLKFYNMYQTERFETSNFNTVMAIILTILLAYLTYNFVEKFTRHAAPKGRLFKSVFYSWSSLALACSLIWGISLANGGKILGGKDEYVAELQRRVGVCFINDSREKLGQECIVPDSEKKSLLIAGDSYAAGFSAPLRKNNSLDVSEFTSSSCPFNLDYDFSIRPQSCRMINDERKTLILSRNFDYIFIASWWGMTDSPGQIENLISSVNKILEGTTSEIYLYGPSPLFYSAVPDIYRRQIRKGWQNPVVSAMKVYPAERAKLLAALKDPRVHLIDPVSFFCDETINCRYRDEKDLFFIDNGHLSLHGINTLLRSTTPFLGN